MSGTRCMKCLRLGWDANLHATAEHDKLIAEAEDSAQEEDGFAKVRRAAARLGPGLIGTLRWIDDRCQKARMHPLDPWWLQAFSSFYESGKLVFVADVGLRGIKSYSVSRSIVNDALFANRKLDPGTIGVIPIMSSDRTEATDRFHTIKRILRACGVSPRKKVEDDGDGDIIPGGVDITYASRTLPSGGGLIEVTDWRGHHIEFRVYPAKITGAVGYTGVAGFADEVDLWPVDELGVSDSDVASVQTGGRANPADVVLDRLLERFTTTIASAHLYIVSASYRGHQSAHARKVRDGDTPIQYVARLGALGAKRDDEQRARLAAAIGSDDPRLHEPANPESPYIPAWVTNPASSIETCYMLSRSRLGPMFGRYGGRPDEADLSTQHPISRVVIANDMRDYLVDVVAGVAPAFNSWAVIVVGLTAWRRIHVLADLSAPTLNIASLQRFEGNQISVIATPAKHEARLRSELAALPTSATHIPAIAGIEVHDNKVLRAGPLATLYEQQRLMHACAPFDADLVAEIRGHTHEGTSPRVEALAAAVARLIGVYPWLQASAGETVKGPMLIETFTGPMADEHQLSLLQRLGARL